MRILVGVVAILFLSASICLTADARPARPPMAPMQLWTNQPDVFATSFLMAQEQPEDPHRDMDEHPPIPMPRKTDAPTPSIFADTPSAVVFFVVGVVGWVALAVGVFFLERRPMPAKTP